MPYLCSCTARGHCGRRRLPLDIGRTDGLTDCAGRREGECRPARRHGGSLRASVLRLGTRAARHASARLRPRGRRRLDGGSAREPRGMHPPSEIGRILQSARRASGAGAPRGWRRSVAGSRCGALLCAALLLDIHPDISRRLYGRCGALLCAVLPPMPRRLGLHHHCPVLPAGNSHAPRSHRRRLGLHHHCPVLLARRGRAGPVAPRRRLPCIDLGRAGVHNEGPSPARPLVSAARPCLPLSGLAASMPPPPDRIFAPGRILAPHLPCLALMSARRTP